jgi:ferrochelatase
VKIAVVLFNLGGPDSLDAVKPFLENLFSDPAIIGLPAILRKPLAKFIAARRTPMARAIYAELGGASPILAETQDQAEALRLELISRGFEARCFVAMRCWHPFTCEAVRSVELYRPDRIILLPLYPQYSTTTSRSSLTEWYKQAARGKINFPSQEVCCYAFENGFIDALVDILREGLARRKAGIHYRILFSAHGLPKRTVQRGDPYQWQVEQTVAAVMRKLGDAKLEWQICYQSRVGPLEWIGPATQSEVQRAGTEGKGVIIQPVAFVSEHSETLVELDVEYLKVAKAAGVADYIRVPTARTHPAFIRGLANLVQVAVTSDRPVTCAPDRICPSGKICEQDFRR